MPRILPIHAFYQQSLSHLLIDVRSPAEFAAGHIPGAHSIPLFSNDERAVVGTLYTQQSKEAAILKGLEFVGPKMADFAKTVNELSQSNKIYVYCWRGGMRSNSFAWLIESLGYEVFTLEKGYKAFRNLVLNSFDKELKLYIIGGMTGSGKTPVLHELKKLGHQVIDLEKLASHKGSAFGSIGEKEQPSNEHFENLLFSEVYHTDADKYCFVEDESRMIGRLSIPDAFYQQMRAARVLKLEIPQEKRVLHLIEDYTHTDSEKLLFATEKLHKRLGGLRVKQITQHISEHNFRDAASLLLEYYDKTYRYGLSTRPEENIINMESDTVDAAVNAKRILEKIDLTE
jgi:tRNA 2-selenouridine synthase